MGGVVEEVKEKASEFIKMFGAELALEFYRDDIAYVVEEFCKGYTTSSLSKLINESQMLELPESFYKAIGKYKGVLKEYDAERLAKMLFELISDVRPDLGEVLVSSSDKGAAWLYRCAEAARDRIANPEKYVEELEKAQTVKVTCDNCHKSFRILKEDAEQMKQCPFCGSSGEEPTSKPSTDMVA